MKFHANMESTPYCCGMCEAGDFDPDDDDYSYWGFESESPEGLIEELLEEAGGRPVLFNFVKETDWKGDLNKEYNVPELRKAVQTHPNAVHLWKGINPGSENRIDSYLIKDYKND